MSTEGEWELTIMEDMESCLSSSDEVMMPPPPPGQVVTKKNGDMNPSKEVTSAENNHSSAEDQDLGISEDMTLHDYACQYYQWNVVHRKSLLTSENVEAYLAKYTINTKGKKYYQQNADKVKESVQGNTVQNYLAGSRKTYDSFKTIFLRKCTCPRARVTPCTYNEVIPAAISCPVVGSSSETTNRESLDRLETSLFGSVLSESESDDELCIPPTENE